MQLSPMNIDIISELLSLLTQFTQTRHRILKQNLQCIHTHNFIPKDLRADDFSSILNDAITEYIINERLVLRDTDTISFGPQNTAMFKPVPDQEAQNLLKQNKLEYTRLQNKKIQENIIHERVALKLINIKKNMNLSNEALAS